MPRWKALPDQLDPQVKEFTGQLRRLVDRAELSIAALADRTGYSKTSWERYLNGRLLAPKGAIVALAEVTGTHPIHLTTMWELAERAWSRSEMRHDLTMEAIRITQARAALGEFGAPSAGAGSAGRTTRRSAGARAAPGIAGPTGVSPTIPPQPTAPDADARAGARRRPGTGGNSREAAGRQGPARAGGRTARSYTPPPASGRTPAAPGRYGAPPRGVDPGAASGGRGGRRQTAMFLAGFVGVLLVIAGFLLLTGRGGDKKNDEGTAKSPAPSTSTAAGLPAGVKCVGGDCTGKDAEAMGCGGDLVTTARTATVGTVTVEVRYSRTCGAVWGRITGAGPGDEVRLTVGATAGRTGTVTEAGDTLAYTPMVAVPNATGAKACATLSNGRTGCTR
ncbi:DUF2690 domain-containing protein [Streptomyces sp. NPDC002514]|uniref:helix-turn-helix domain-containing protein n=1 Tax=Streptomyces sp. NPDC001270 TaxID=3364554 RepID=UPI0036B7FD2E